LYSKAKREAKSPRYRMLGLPVVTGGHSRMSIL
jgi:hypothetical protein